MFDNLHWTDVSVGVWEWPWFKMVIYANYADNFRKDTIKQSLKRQ